MELQPEERELIEAARQLLLDEDHWVCNSPAVDCNLMPVKPQDERACRWCLVGAIAHFSPAGIAPSGVLYFLDMKVREFVPDLAAFAEEEELVVEWYQDKIFDFEMLHRFLAFVLA